MKIIKALCMPLGAFLACIFAFPLAVEVMEWIATKMDPEGAGSIQLRTTYRVGVVGMILFGLSVVEATLSRELRQSRCWPALAGAASIFAFASLAITYGGLQLRNAFVNLATAESVSPDRLLMDLDRARIPLWTGWICILLGSLVVSVIRLRAPSLTDKRAGQARNRIGISAAGASFLAIAFAGFLANRGLQDLRFYFESAESLEPSMIAGAINHITFDAVFLVVLSCMLTAIALLFTGLAGKRPVHDRAQATLPEPVT